MDVDEITAPYAVPRWVEYLHSMRRFDVSQAGKAAGGEVSNDFSPDIHADYYKGILSLSGVYFAVGALIILGFIISAFVSLCCRSKVHKLPKATGVRKLFSRLFSARFWYVACAVIIVAMSAAALSQVTKFRDFVSEAVEDVEHLSDHFAEAGILSATELGPSLTSVHADASAFAAAIAGSDSAASQDMNHIADALSAGASASFSFSTALNATADELDITFLDTSSSTNLKSTYKGVAVGGIVVIALFFSFMIISAFTALKKKACATAFRACHAVFIFTVISVFIFSGLFLAISLVSADVCAEPTESIVKALDFIGADADTKATAEYYMTCNNAGVAPSGAATYFANADAQLEDAKSDMSVFHATHGTDAWFGPFEAQFLAINESIYAADVTLHTVEAVSGCEEIHNLYNNILNHICVEGTWGVTATWGLATAISTLFFFMGISAARMCWRHPGDPEEKAPEASKGDSHAAAIEMSSSASQQASYVTVGPGASI